MRKALLLLDFGLDDFVLFGTAIFMYFCAAAKDIVAFIGIRTIKACVPFAQSVHVTRAIFGTKHGYGKDNRKVPWEKFRIENWPYFHGSD